MKKFLLSVLLVLAAVCNSFAQETTHVCYEWDFDNPSDYANGETLPEGWLTTGTNLFSRAEAEYYGLNPANSGNYVVASLSSNNTNRDEALYTKMLDLKGGVEYTVTFYLRTGNATPITIRTTGIKVTAGTAQDAESQTIDILDTGKTYSFGQWTKYDGTFTPDADGKYCVCFSLYTSMARCGDVAFDDISIEGDEPESTGGGGTTTSSEKTIGEANDITSSVVQNYDGIMNFYYKNSKSTFMYTAEQLGFDASNITKIVVPFSGGSKSYPATVKIWMQNTEDAACPATMSEEGMTLVYDNSNFTVPFTGATDAEGEMVFELPQGFEYTGKNLVFHFQHEANSYQGSPQIVYPIVTGSTCPTFYCGRADAGLSYINNNNMYDYNFAPVVKLTYGAIAEKPAALNVAETAINLGEIGVGESVSHTIQIFGTSLTGDITISAPTTEALALSSSTISKDDAMAVSGAELTFTVTPADVNVTSDVVTISTPGCDDVEVTVTWTPIVTAQENSVQIGNISGKTQTAEVNGESVSDAPLNFLFKHSKSEFIYTAEDLKAIGGEKKITKLAFPVYGGGRNITTNVKVWLLNTDATEASCFTDVATMKNVMDKASYKVNATASTETKDWLEFELDKPFKYRGGNLLVVMEANSSEYMMPNLKWGVDTSKEARNVYHRRGDSDASFNGEYGTWTYQYFPVVNISFEDFVDMTYFIDSEEVEEANIGDVFVGESKSIDVYVKCPDAAGDVTVSDIVADVISELSFSPATLSKADLASEKGAKLTLTVNAENIAPNSTTLSFMCDGAVIETLPVSWNSIESSAINNITLDGPACVKVYDVNGRCLLNQDNVTNVKEALSTLNNGLYIVKVGNKVYKTNVVK